MDRLKDFQLILVVTLSACCCLSTGQSNDGQNISWWKSTIVYQIYPRSFKDSDGDGVGDLRGIISELDYFTYLGVDSFWLSPVYKSPMVDFGYDISDYTDIDPIFGTIQDFDDLMVEAHNKSLKVIMDFVPGHTSTQHEWFKKSVQREGNYTDYYIWDDGKLLDNGTRAPPNNWLSVFGGSAWAWNDDRQQYYYHAFVPEQADLNYRDDNVQWEMKNVLRFWLDKGVDGFRVDAIEKLYEVTDLSLDEPVSGLNVTPFQYEYLSHNYTSYLPENVPTVASWYDVLREYQQKDGFERYMILELYGDPSIRNLYFTTGGNPFNMELVEMQSGLTGYDVRDRVMHEYDSLPSGEWPNFVLGNHDRHRVSNKFGPQYADVYNMLLLTLWGTPTTYYGEEIGMQEGVISWEETVDPWGLNYGPDHFSEFSRDPERTPMQWTDGYQAGFTTGNSTWLPLGVNYQTLNVKTEQDSHDLTSVQLYKRLALLRKQPTFQTGSFKLAYVDENIFSYLREANDQSFLIALNVGQQEVTTDFTSYGSSQNGKVIAHTPGLDSTHVHDLQEVSLASVTLQPGDGMVLQLHKGAPIIG